MYLFGMLCSFFPLFAVAVTITTEYKVGDEVYTNIDKAQYAALAQPQSGSGMIEDSLEARTVIKRYLDQNHLRFSEEERRALYQMHLERLHTTAEQFEAYLRSAGVSSAVFIEELAYRQEVTRWMMHTYGWREQVTPAELAAFKSRMRKEGEHQQKLSFDVLKVTDPKRVPKELTEDFWVQHASELTAYRDVSYDRVPEPYEDFLRTHGVNAVSPPIEAFGAWHIVRVREKTESQLPDDALLRHYLLEQKCLKQMRSWLAEQLPWVYHKAV